MKFTIHILLLSSLLLSSAVTYAAISSDTDAYIAALAQLLEQKTIGDAELVTILEAAEDGEVVNPIPPVRAQTSVEHFVANNALEELLQSEIDAAQVAYWAEENIKEQDRVRKKRKQTQEETKELWKDIASVLSTGWDHTCAVATNGAVKCWGYDYYGRSTAPHGIFQSVSAGKRHTCGVKIDGAVECWGYDGDGRSTAPHGIFQSVSAGGRHTCGVKAGGTINCWGDNTYGQTSAPSGVFRSVSAGAFHTCGVKADGIVKCWGYDKYGQASPPSGFFQSVSAGGDRTCGLKIDASVECWGYNPYRQSTTFWGVFKSVSTGRDHTCGIRVDGAVECWGYLFNKHFFRWGKFFPTIHYGTFQSVAAGRNHICGAKVDGTIECWGDNSHAQLSVPDELAVSMGQINEVQNQYYYTFISSIQRIRACIGLF